MDTHNSLARLPRRKVLQWFAAAAAIDITDFTSFAQNQTSAVGYGTDPDLTKVYSPGDVWKLTLTDTERSATVALADLIFPKDDLGPAASELHLVDFIDEWVSAPYPNQERDRKVVIPGLQWLDEESSSRFQKPFAELEEKQMTAICDDLCAEKPATPELAKGARFFERFKAICSGGYYSTPEGWAAIGYVGNVASGVFYGPPQEILDQLGLEQTVKD